MGSPSSGGGNTLPRRRSSRARTVSRVPCLVLALALSVAAPVLTPAAAQDGADRERQIQQLEELESALEEGRRRQQALAAEAERLARELVELRDELIAAAELVRGQEREITAITSRLAALQAEERAKAAAFERRRGELARVLASLARLSRQPPVAFAASPADALDTVHTSILLSAVVPDLEMRAQTIGAELAAVRGIRAEIAGQQVELAEAHARLEQEQTSLAQLLDFKGAEQERAREEQLAGRSRLDVLAAEAGDLQELLGQLETRAGPEEEPPAGTRPFAELRGHLPLPAEGRIVLSYGETDPAGLPSRGLSLEVLPAAQAVTPHDGRIVFAGPFRSYGELLIISHGGGYHTLIAGLSRIYGRVGQWLLAGEPVGQAGSGESGISTIYVELRRNGEPINPLPWLAAR